MRATTLWRQLWRFLCHGHGRNATPATINLSLRHADAITVNMDMVKQTIATACERRRSEDAAQAATLLELAALHDEAAKYYADNGDHLPHRCPQCLARYHDGEAVGKLAQCPKCGTPLEYRPQAEQHRRYAQAARVAASALQFHTLEPMRWVQPPEPLATGEAPTMGNACASPALLVTGALKPRRKGGKRAA